MAAMKKEEGATIDNAHKVSVELKEENGCFTVITDIRDYLPDTGLIDSDMLGEAFEPEERFEAPDGSDIIFDTDYYGKKRPASTVAGPFA